MDIFPKDIQYLIRKIWFQEILKELLYIMAEIRYLDDMSVYIARQWANDPQQNIVVNWSDSVVTKFEGQWNISGELK